MKLCHAEDNLARKSINGESRFVRVLTLPGRPTCEVRDLEEDVAINRWIYQMYGFQRSGAPHCWERVRCKPPITTWV